jgi:hypothetical protein
MTVGELSTTRRLWTRMQRAPHHRWQWTTLRAAAAPQHEAFKPRHAEVCCCP